MIKASLVLIISISVGATKISFDRDGMLSAAKADGIDLNILPMTPAALDSIEALYTPVVVPAVLQNATRIDVHSHVVPSWYRALVPLTGDSPTPNWTVESHFALMASQSIRRSIVSISTPGATVFAGDAAKSIALARLLNEYLAALTSVYPEHFSFYATTPLPYVEAAITEVNYALGTLHGSAIGLLSNFEGLYLGNAQLTPFFTYLNQLTNISSPSRNPVIFVHPNAPCLHYPGGSGSLIPANPTLYPTGTVEFYFETARTFMDLSLSRTLINPTTLNRIVPHAGGSFPSIISRSLSLASGQVRDQNMEVYARRLWWDTAGPIFPFQVQGLLGYGIRPS
ncbi:hypothetical protein BCR34DRAFT_567201 [Clohesyomyces aquaticus]|uniref:Amidohydrolase-related domain-containing protein n=1 Tax=Clohesyomyces aquaticus TaxID=1231657 RepID=A0A1Y1ZJ64_9PLEO|nr:hypothetical protein BCR34DRAFT_567201 [Clohesyomyces aquaticus]